MSILSTEKLGHAFHDKWLFRDVYFGMQQGARIALVGINGTGKSTMLKILANRIIPSEGAIVQQKGITTGYLDQNPDFEAFDTVNDFIYSQDNPRQLLVREYDKLLNTGEDEKRLQEVIDQMTILEAWSYENDIKSILNRLGITRLDQEIVSLSGGQKKRLSLAKLLIDEPDVYILDEPTNHLDIETIEWLEKLLSDTNKTVLLVTHDRYFLDKVCNEIIELENGVLHTYKGNYQYFLEKKAERETAQKASLEKNRNLLKKELEWMRRQPQARGTKSKARIDAFYDLKEKTTITKSSTSLSLAIKETRQGKKIAEFNQVSKSYQQKTIVDNFSYTFKKGDRIGLAGRNGSGKSTLLNILTQTIKPDRGNVEIGETTKFGYYKQTSTLFDGEERVLDSIKNIAENIPLANGKVITASQLLTQFLFPPEKQFIPVNKLSGGEKKRLQLMRVLIENPNFLILDEPTNDFDIDTLNVLENFLEEFTGVIVLVSHDRYLLDRIADQLFIMKEDHPVSIYNGNYSDYREEQELIKKSANQPKADIKKQTPVQNEKTQLKLSYKEKLEHEQLEREITILENKIKLQTQSLLETTDPVQINSVAEELKKLQEHLDAKTDRWILLSESL